MGLRSEAKGCLDHTQAAGFVAICNQRFVRSLQIQDRAAASCRLDTRLVRSR